NIIKGAQKIKKNTTTILTCDKKSFNLLKNLMNKDFSCYFVSSSLPRHALLATVLYEALGTM
ncbi:MAG: hypothetical protein LRZ93_00760, partial [Clostridiales bacterium]|nr:hypothetical protein [Clostridiales bacterium]